MNSLRQRQSVQTTISEQQQQQQQQQQEEEEEEVCSICLGGLSEDTKVVLPCQHIFHSNCISEWSQSSENRTTLSCPLCRSETNKKVVEELQRDLSVVDYILLVPMFFVLVLRFIPKLIMSSFRSLLFCAGVLVRYMIRGMHATH